MMASAISALSYSSSNYNLSISSLTLSVSPNSLTFIILCGNLLKAAATEPHCIKTFALNLPMSFTPKQVNESLKEWNVKVKLQKSFVDWIIEKEYKPEYGASSLKRALQHHGDDLLGEELLKGSLADTEVVEISVIEDKPYLKPVKKKD